MPETISGMSPPPTPRSKSATWAHLSSFLWWPRKVAGNDAGDHRHAVAWTRRRDRGAHGTRRCAHHERPTGAEYCARRNLPALYGGARSGAAYDCRDWTESPRRHDAKAFVHRGSEVGDPKKRPKRLCAGRDVRRQ